MSQLIKADFEISVVASSTLIELEEGVYKLDLLHQTYQEVVIVDRTFEKSLEELWNQSDKKVRRFKRRMKRRVRRAVIHFICNPYVSATIAIIIYYLINFYNK